MGSTEPGAHDQFARLLTDFKGTDHQPMWIGDSIYFVSDRELRR
jgi:hypothetical protein